MKSGNNGGPHECNGLKRPRYFHGMLLDERDFKDEQAYHIKKRWLLNRMLYGCGVVCGLDLKRASGTGVSIGPGMAFDCRGREIWVPEDYAVEIKDLLARDDFRDACDDTDPPPLPETYYLCLSYLECESDPVSSHISDNACKTRGCENSRTQEGFKVGLMKCPEGEIEQGLLGRLITGRPRKSGNAYQQSASYDAADQADATLLDFLKEWCCDPVPCPCEDPCECQCVIVGRFVVDAEGCIKELCANDCRKYVMTGHMLQYLFTSLFSIAGQTAADGTATSDFNAARVAGNPIEALCTLLPWLAQLHQLEKKKSLATAVRELAVKMEAGRAEVEDIQARLILQRSGLHKANAKELADYVNKHPEDAELIKAVWRVERQRPGGVRTTVANAVESAARHRYPDVHRAVTEALKRAK